MKRTWAIIGISDVAGSFNLALWRVQRSLRRENSCQNGIDWSTFGVQCPMFASMRAVAVACSRFIGVVPSTEPGQAFAAANASTTFAVRHLKSHACLCTSRIWSSNFFGLLAETAGSTTPWRMTMPEPDQVPRQLRAIYDLLSVEENAALAGGNPEKIIQWLYRILDIIDSKTSHLLQLNAIVLAVQTFLVNGILAARSVSRLTLFASVLFLLVPFLGTMACMWVFRIAWPFLDWQKAGSLAITDRTTVEQQMRREFVELAKVCDRRTRFHGWVWWSTLASIVLLPLSVWIRFRSFF